VIVLEDDLRRTFTERVGDAPALNDPAGTAIRRARRIRRHRGLLGGAAATVAVAVLGGGLAAVQDWRLSRPVTAEQAAGDATPVAETTFAIPEPTVEPSLGPRPDVDLYADGYVWTAGGVRIPVSERETRVTRAYRIPLGWVLGGGHDVQLVNTDGSTVRLSVGSRWVLSSDGTRIAYVVDGSMRVAVLEPGGLVDIATTGVGKETVPLAFAGDQVVIGEVEENGTLARVDRWEPNGLYRPNWRQQALTVYEAPVGDVVAQVPTALGACLVRLAVATDGLRPATDEACGIGVSHTGPPPTVSPDGRWLAVRTPATVAIYDLRTVFRSPIPAATCGSVVTTDLTWESAGKLLAADGRAAVRCGPDGTVEPVALPSGLPDGWKFVAARRS